MTLVSIITPSLNQASYLRQAIRSVLDQDHAALEYLIVDGGSSDGSRDIIQEYSARLAWWVSEPDAGQAQAINKGLARAHGDIVAWLNSDDYYLPGAVAAAVRTFDAHPEAVMVYANMRAVDDQDRILNMLTYEQLSLQDLLCFRIIGQPAAFMRRAAVADAGGLSTDLHLLLDHHLWIRLARLGPIVHVDDAWAAARYHGAAKNRAHAAEFGSEAFKILDWASGQPDLSGQLQPVLSRARASAHRVDARYLLDGGQPRAALRAWLRALWLHPPTAFARMNLLAASLLEILGLGTLRRTFLRRRQERLSG